MQRRLQQQQLSLHLWSHNFADRHLGRLNWSRHHHHLRHTTIRLARCSIHVASRPRTRRIAPCYASYLARTSSNP